MKNLKEIHISTQWEPRLFFTNLEISKIYAAVDNSTDVFFSYDLITSGVPAIYLLPKGSAEMAWIRVEEPDTQRFAMNLKANELFDPKQEGLIYIQEQTHQELERAIRAVAHILRERLSDEV